MVDLEENILTKIVALLYLGKVNGTQSGKGNILSRGLMS